MARAGAVEEGGEKSRKWAASWPGGAILVRWRCGAPATDAADLRHVWEMAGQCSRAKAEIYKKVVQPGQGAPLEARTESPAHQTFGNYWTTSCKHWMLVHWRQTQPLLQSNRAGVRWLSQDLCTRREEIPGQSKVGGIAAKTSFDQLLVHYKCTVMDEINGLYLQLP